MAFGLFTQSAQAQKIALVDVNAVVTSMPEYQAATEKVQTLTKAYQDSLKSMQTKYQATKDTYDKLGATASEEMKKKENDDLAGLQKSYSDFYDAKFGQTGELAQMQQNLMKPITERLKNILDSFRKKEKLAMILPASGAVSFDPELDQTVKFQDYLKTQP
jgi:outer membrane protein